MKLHKIIFTIYFILIINNSNAQTLPLPPRAADALSGSAFINLIWSMPLEQREEQIYSQIISGNIPDFMRQLVEVTAIANIGGNNVTAKYFVIPEYLAVGSDSNYFLTPMTPLLAQRICNAINATLPTKKMVDQIYSAALCKLRPQPIPPTPQMTTVPVFSQHNDSVKAIRFPVLGQFPFGTLVGGTKKDVIISNRIYQNLNPNVPKPVVIYGWHQLNGQPIQPVYNGHGETYADYSHGIRIVLDSVIVDGVPKKFAQLLADPVYSILVSDEGTILKAYYTLAGNSVPSPKSFCVEWQNSTSLKISVSPLSGTTYKVFFGTDGIFFNDSTSEFNNNIIINNLLTDSIYFFRLKAYNSNGFSLFSEVLGGIPSSIQPKVLIVNGFDRSSTGNTFNFIRQHGNAFKNNGFSFSSATNDAVLQGLISINNYSIVDYILGDESTADETFSTAEQELIKNYLRNGGKLFVSGAEIAWDLDNRGTTSDKEFIHNFLKCSYVYDAPNNQAGVFYQAEPVAGSIFDGVGSINYDNGTQGTINVRYPDVINGVNGGINCLRYSNVTNQFAAVFFEGNFPGGTLPGKVVTVGFPFETIYPESKRNIFLNKILNFFDGTVDVKNDFFTDELSYQLFQNYPNPFNPNTVISYQISEDSKVNLKVYDIIGNEVATLVDEFKSSGKYNISFNGKGLSTGVYYYTLITGDFVQSRKMLLIK